MSREQPIETAPKDGRIVTVLWIDDDERQNQSVARYRNLEQLRKAGGDWDDNDSGWWIFINSETQKKITPFAWVNEEDDDEDAQ